MFNIEQFLNSSTRANSLHYQSPCCPKAEPYYQKLFDPEQVNFDSQTGCFYLKSDPNKRQLAKFKTAYVRGQADWCLPESDDLYSILLKNPTWDPDLEEAVGYRNGILILAEYLFVVRLINPAVCQAKRPVRISESHNYQAELKKKFDQYFKEYTGFSH